MPRHASTHAAGVVITDRTITDYVPVSVNGGSVVTQFDMDTIAELGLLKFDFLALRYLTIINSAEVAVREKHKDFDLSAVDVNDHETYELISHGLTDGVFQLESRGMRQMLTQLKPQSIDDIIAAIALYRPGPMDSIPKYIASRNDPGSIDYKIPMLKPILDVTYGCIVYQEQVMQIFREIAGYSFGHADIVRRAISKKKADVLNSEEEAFVRGAMANGISAEDATALFGDIVSFANYAFNKSHAAAYAVLSFRTAYLKVHYPREYYSALLTSVFGSADKIAEYSAECKKIGVSILPPDVNESRSSFCVQSDNIRYGLLSIKNIGSQFVDALVRERLTNGAFSDFDDFVERMRRHDMNKKQLEALIKSGAMDSLGPRRSQMLAVYEGIMETRAARRDEDQLDMFSMGGEDIAPVQKTKFPDVAEFSSRERLMLEKESCGVYLSGHILDDYAESIRRADPDVISEIKASFDDEADPENAPQMTYRDRSRVKLCGIVTSRTNKTTRNGDGMAFVTIEDRSGEIELICFSRFCESFGHMLLVNSPVTVEGNLTVKDDEDVKVILNSAEVLVEDTSLPPEAPKVQRAEPVRKPEAVRKTINKLYLRVPSVDSREYLRAKSLVQIFEGTIPVIFYDSRAGAYLTDDIILSGVTPFVVKELGEIIGEDNVVIR